jgi:hypothetical protein
VFAVGILQEPFRWAEIEQLVYSEHRMERRLVGSTLARMPYAFSAAQRRNAEPSAIAPRALDLIRQLMGDADDQVQKSLSWALREWSRVARVAVEQLLDQETRATVRAQDGSRAWVIRDALALLDPRVADALRSQVAGIRRRPGAPSTSPASQAATTFLGAPDAAAQLADQAVAMQGERYARRSA